MSQRLYLSEALVGMTHMYLYCSLSTIEFATCWMLILQMHLGICFTGANRLYDLKTALKHPKTRVLQHMTTHQPRFFSVCSARPQRI